ncbi:DUF5008 domain-containing protein [Sphingobacterium gobiense]|uniref:Uncharacterized protein n=1 Tax=Sphingobacterium gobiense TaxID=1382456 RepID=A0A2S9JSD8_9SPHI|nr:DUF5008 domain-containing protein [Sphingobacterium gobiense]PRD56170.1 hypothetical protein C5749_02535 [Sphingobacterium gobiense]
MKNLRTRYILGILCLSIMLGGCNKETTFFSEPYGEGKPPLGITFDPAQVPSPNVGDIGSIIKLKANGLNEYLDKAVFKFNGQEAEIVRVNGDEVEVKVPPYASTGVTSITVDDVIIFGPEFTVNGKVRIDPTWEAIAGANGSVNGRLLTNDGKVIYVGNFTDYNRRGLVRPINRIARTFSNGIYDVSFRTGQGANGSLNSIVHIGNHYYLSGGFSAFGQKRDNISNITRIHLHGDVDTVGVHPFRRPDQSDTLKYVPAFNGGFNSAISHLYPQENKLIATGNFRYYVSRRYDQPNRLETRDSVILDSVEIRHVARLNLDGTLDKTFRFNGDIPFAGGNGDIGTLLHESGPHQGKILVHGWFNRFDGKEVGYVTRLNANGTIDETFNPGGSGADLYITNMTYNAVTNKYVAVGSFRTYNGKPAMRLALLNDDGTLDETFQAQTFLNGLPTYAKQLDDGLIAVAGTFLTYGNVTRNRFMILNPDGNLADPLLNATGQLLGGVNQIIETRSEDNKRALLFFGWNLSKFDNKDVSNIFRVIIE